MASITTYNNISVSEFMKPTVSSEKQSLLTQLEEMKCIVNEMMSLGELAVLPEDKELMKEIVSSLHHKVQHRINSVGKMKELVGKIETVIQKKSNTDDPTKAPSAQRGTIVSSMHALAKLPKEKELRNWATMLSITRNLSGLANEVIKEEEQYAQGQIRHWQSQMQSSYDFKSSQPIDTFKILMGTTPMQEVVDSGKRISPRPIHLPKDTGVNMQQAKESHWNNSIQTHFAQQSFIEGVQSLSIIHGQKACSQLGNLPTDIKNSISLSIDPLQKMMVVTYKGEEKRVAYSYTPHALYFNSPKGKTTSFEDLLDIQEKGFVQTESGDSSESVSSYTKEEQIKALKDQVIVQLQKNYDINIEALKHPETGDTILNITSATSDLPVCMHLRDLTIDAQSGNIQAMHGKKKLAIATVTGKNIDIMPSFADEMMESLLTSIPKGAKKLLSVLLKEADLVIDPALTNGEQITAVNREHSSLINNSSLLQDIHLLLTNIELHKIAQQKQVLHYIEQSNTNVTSLRETFESFLKESNKYFESKSQQRDHGVITQIKKFLGRFFK